MWPYIWGLWVVAGLALELYALKRRAKGDTLSEQVWALGRWAKARKAEALFHILLLGFFTWLGLHFVFGI